MGRHATGQFHCPCGSWYDDDEVCCPLCGKPTDLWFDVDAARDSRRELQAQRAEDEAIQRDSLAVRGIGRHRKDGG